MVKFLHSFIIDNNMLLLVFTVLINNNLKTQLYKYNKSISMAGAVQVEANLQEQLSDHLHFRQPWTVEMLTYGKMQHIAIITLELALVTLEWAFVAVCELVSG